LSAAYYDHLQVGLPDIVFFKCINNRCRNFQTQSQFIRKAAHRYSEHLENQLSKKS